MRAVRTLNLTTPLTEGLDVEAAQKALKVPAPKGFTVKAFLAGHVDGKFGPETMRATKRAEWWLGYPEAQIDGAYGDTLHGYLTGAKAVPPTYALRRHLRLAAAKRRPLRENALQAARGKLGTKERTGQNDSMFNDWYGMRGPWCAMFVTWAYVTAGAKQAFTRAHRYAYVPYVVADARAGRNHLAVTSDPKPGDLVCFDWNQDGIFDHIGLFETWLKQGADFHSIEGNTAVGNDSNGGEVMRRRRKNVAGVVFVRVGL